MKDLHKMSCQKLVGYIDYLDYKPTMYHSLTIYSDGSGQLNVYSKNKDPKKIFSFYSPTECKLKLLQYTGVVN